MRNETWHDGKLIEVVETDDPEPTETQHTITSTALDSLQSSLADPKVNSISEIKSVLGTFIDNIKGV